MIELSILSRKYRGKAGKQPKKAVNFLLNIPKLSKISNIF